MKILKTISIILASLVIAYGSSQVYYLKKQCKLYRDISVNTLKYAVDYNSMKGYHIIYDVKLSDSQIEEISKLIKEEKIYQNIRWSEAQREALYKIISEIKRQKRI